MASMVRPALLKQVASRAPAASSRTAPSLLAEAVLQRQSLSATAARGAAFHTTARRAILPPLPQRVEGGVNDPARVPPPSPSHGSYHWTFERLLAAGLVPITVAPFAAGSLNPAMDALLCGLVLVHSHMGFQSIIIDYLPKWRMPRIHRGAMWALNAATALVGLGLYEFETTDVGMTEAVSRLWHA